MFLFVNVVYGQVKPGRQGVEPVKPTGPGVLEGKL